MSNKKTSEKTEKKKFDTNIILTAISTLAAVLSVYSAFIFNKNAQESDLPKPIISYIGQFRDYYADYETPCQRSVDLDSQWWIDFVIVFDVSNFGGKPVSLVNVKSEEIETFHPSIQAELNLSFFGNPERFNEWLSNYTGNSLSWLYQSKEKMDYTTPPISVGIGETRRLILLANQHAQIKADMSPQEVFEALRDVNWNAKVSFMFANGGIEQEIIPVIHPYSSISKTTSLTEYDSCLQLQP